MADVVLCVDIGTSSLKTALIDAEGKYHSSYRYNFNHTSLKPDTWYNALVCSVSNLSKQIHDINFIKAICISGNGPTLACDSFVYLWNEPLSIFNLSEAEKEFSSKSLFLPRLLSLKNMYKDEWESISTLFSGPEFLIYQLTGTKITILPEKRFQIAYWNDEKLENLNIDKRKIPPFVQPGYNAGKITQKTAKDLGLSPEVEVFCGSPDFVAALIGTNTLFPGALCDRAGTSEGLNLCTNRPIYNEKIRTLPSVVENLFNASVLLPDSGIRVRKCIEEKDFNKLETIALEIKESLNILKKASNYKIDKMKATGGQILNDEWNQMKADIADIQIEVTFSTDAELTGDAITAFYGMGIFNSLKDGADAMVKTRKIFTPSNFTSAK